MTPTQILINAGAGGISAWLTVFFTKANALAVKKARMAQIIGALAGIVAAVVSPDFEAVLVTDQVLELGSSVALTLISSLGWWKLSLQPKIEAGTGLVSTLHSKTAGVGVG